MTTIQDRLVPAEHDVPDQSSASVPDLVAARARKTPDALALMQGPHPP